MGAEVKISSGVGGNVAIAGDAAGNFLVSWEAADRDSQGVYARLFDKTATARGGEFLVNTTTAGLQRRPAVATVKAGGWLIVWQGQGATAADAHIYGQFLGGGGSFIGPEFRVSQGFGPTQIAPAVAQLASGNFMVAWTDWKDPFPIGVFSVELDHPRQRREPGDGDQHAADRLADPHRAGDLRRQHPDSLGRLHRQPHASGDLGPPPDLLAPASRLTPLTRRHNPAGFLVPRGTGFYSSFDSWSAQTRPDITLGRKRVDLAGSIWPSAMAAAKAAGSIGGSQTPVPRSPAATWLHSSAGSER